MNKIPKKEQPNNSLHQHALALPLELKDSLRIRDGLGSHETSPVRWPLFSQTQWVTDLGYFWVSHN